jgi:transcriptional regulator with XRE-family HTH domain
VASPREIQSTCTEVVRLLQTERERQELAMLTVAERSGLSQQMVSYVERGMRRPTLETVLRMADALGVDLADLLRQAQSVPRAKPRRK